MRESSLASRKTARCAARVPRPRVSATSGPGMGPREDSGVCCERVGSGAEDRLLSRVGAPYLAGFAALGGGQPNLQVILLGIEGVDILWPRRHDLYVVARCGRRSGR